jgi:hypothetical protein
MTRRFRLTATACVIAVSICGVAAADESEVAEQLFREGHALLKEQRYTDACSKFAESELHDKASGTLLALAYCQELAKTFASAQASYAAAADLAKAENQGERQRAATDRAEALARRVSTLTVEVPEALQTLPGLRITNNGIELARASWGHPVPSDGGTFDIQVTAVNRQPWSKQVELGAEQERSVVTVPMLAEVAPSTLEHAGPRTALLAPSAPPAPPPRYWSTQRIVGWSAVGAGTIAGVAALYFTASAKSAENDVQDMLRAEEAAPPSSRVPWDSAGHAREADGRRAAGLAQGFAVTSGALLIGGAALVIIGAEKRDHEAPSVSLGVVPGLAQVNYARAF